MRTPQSGIFALGTASHSYLEFDLRPGANPSDMARVVANLHGPQATTGGVNLVAGFAPDLWRQMTNGDMPDGVTGFERDMVGTGGFVMPATQHDLWLWVAGHAYDKVFDTSLEAMSALDPVATLALETDGWTYKDNRDLTGFIDGTENPTLREAPEVAIVPEGKPGAGGSIVLVQKWNHEAAAWMSLPDQDQERIIGRTKPDSVELPDEIRGPAAHVPRTVIEENGEEQHIFRRNTPFGTPTDHGTTFIGFSADQHRLVRMLERMAGIEDGIRDALTLYATPLTGAYYFVPAVEAFSSFATEEA